MGRESKHHQRPVAIGGRRFGWRRPHRAVTLAELVIVVLIIGIMAAAAGPTFCDTLQAYRVDAAAKRIQLDLELARREARMKGANRTVVFNTTANSYTLQNVPGLNHYGTTYTVSLLDTNYAAQFVSVNFGGDATVIFNSYGAADSGGTVVVKSGSRTRTLTLDANSGKVAIQ